MDVQQSIILCVFFGVVTVNMFSSVNKMTLTPLGEYYGMGVRFTQIWATAIFEHEHFTFLEQTFREVL